MSLISFKKRFQRYFWWIFMVFVRVLAFFVGSWCRSHNLLLLQQPQGLLLLSKPCNRSKISTKIQNKCLFLTEIKSEEKGREQSGREEQSASGAAREPPMRQMMIGRGSSFDLENAIFGISSISASKWCIMLVTFSEFWNRLIPDIGHFGHVSRGPE